MGAGSSLNLPAETRALEKQLRYEAGKNTGTDENPAQELVKLRGLLQQLAEDFDSHDIILRDSSFIKREEDASDIILEASETVLGNGTRILKRSDGSKKQIDPKGVVLETWPDGRKLQTLPEGRSLETLPDGTKINRTQDGVVIVKKTDGSKLQSNPDGTTIELTCDGRVIQYNPETQLRILLEPDGTQTQTNESDGSCIQLFPDGTKIDTDRAGCKIIKYVDGRRVQRNSNGTVIESWDSGHKIQTKVDGSRIEVFPDGRKTQTFVDGSVMEQLPDGRQIKSLVGTYCCVLCPRCKTIMSVQRSAFVVSCRVCRDVILAAKAQVIGAPSGTSLSSTLSQSPETMQEDIRSIFDHYDSNRSNSIDKKELEQMLIELQFPPSSFNTLFDDLNDENDTNEIGWEGFLEFYKRMQKQLTENAHAPILEITKELLLEQQQALQTEKNTLSDKIKLLQDQVAQGNESAGIEAESNQTMLDKIKTEYEMKTQHLKQATDAQRARQRAFLEKKLEKRKMQKSGSSSKID